MSLRLALVLVSSLLVSSAFAGDSQVTIQCKSKTGDVQVESFIPGEADDAMVKFTVDGKSFTFLNGMTVTTLRLNGKDPNVVYPGYQLAAIAGVARAEKKIITIQVLKKDDYDSQIFTLSGNPASVKIVNSRGSSKGTFQAVVEGIDPRDSTGRTYLRDSIQLNCKYDESI